MQNFPRKNIKMFSKGVKQKFILIIIPLIILFLSNPILAQTSTYSYQLLDPSSRNRMHEITISITQPLYEYYQTQSHQIYSNSELGKYVTPAPLIPVSEDLWSIYDNQEDFANAVLMITHQIPYQEILPQKYPIETLSENLGDCDLFCYIAASIMKAGGLDVCLLLFEEQEHMTVGVYLTQSPTSSRTTIGYFNYEEKPYYIAETTGDFENGWQVGECPEILQGATAQIIPLNDLQELPSSYQVYSSLSTPQDSSLFLSVSTDLAIAKNNIQITGILNPSLEGENITLYSSSYSSTVFEIATIETNSEGHFSYIWNSPPGGIISVRANWAGDSNYVAADSNISQIIIIPIQWLLIGGVLLAFIIILIIATIATREPKTKDIEFNPDWDFEQYNF